MSFQSLIVWGKGRSYLYKHLYWQWVICWYTTFTTFINVCTGNGSSVSIPPLPFGPSSFIIVATNMAERLCTLFYFFLDNYIHIYIHTYLGVLNWTATVQDWAHQSFISFFFNPFGDKCLHVFSISNHLQGIWCIQRFNTRTVLSKVYEASVFLSASHCSHTPLPCPTSQSINITLKLQCVLNSEQRHANVSKQRTFILADIDVVPSQGAVYEITCFSARKERQFLSWLQ